MEILRRTQGIDFKAKNSSLMGSVELMLKDADSGKVKEVIKQKNMFTNALDSLFNKSCFNIANIVVSNPATAGGYSGFPRQTPVINKALGGIILFPTALGNSADLLYPSFATHYPTGYASQEEYTQADSRQGAFNGSSSGIIPDTNSYKLVYDWGSSFGNGVIASVALSNINCFKYFNDSSRYVLTPLGSGAWKQFFYDWNRRAVGVNNQGLVIISLQDNKLRLLKFPERKVELWFDYDATPPYVEFEIPNFTFSGYDTWFSVKDDYIHVFKITQTGATSKFNYTKIDCSDWTSTTTSDIQVGANLRGAANYREICAVIGNYLYLPKNDNASVYKINLSNVSDVTEIELPSGATAVDGLAACGSKVFSSSFMIGEDDIARKSDNTTTFLPVYQDGVWIAKVPFESGTYGICADVLTPYCATHADLETAVTKTADKSMTVNYTVAQV